MSKSIEIKGIPESPSIPIPTAPKPSTNKRSVKLSKIAMIKNIILITTLFFSYSATAQEQPTHSFKIENGRLIWQKVYTSGTTPADIVAAIRDKGVVKDIEFNDNLLTGTLSCPTKVKDAGFSPMNVPIYTRYDVTGTVSVQFKDGRYRVSLRNIVIVSDQVHDLLDPTTELDQFALKKDKSAFKPGFLKAPCAIYEYTFNEVFTAMTSSNDDNW